MHAHTPPFTKPEAPYKSRRLYDETSKIAAAQDAKLDPGNDALPSILADFRAVVKRLEAYAERLREKRNLAELARESQKLGLYDDGIPAESAYLASFDPNNYAATLREIGIGDVEPRDVAEIATTIATSQHPMAAEVIREHDERLNGPEDHL